MRCNIFWKYIVCVQGIFLYIARCHNFGVCCVHIRLPFIYNPPQVNKRHSPCWRSLPHSRTLRNTFLLHIILIYMFVVCCLNRCFIHSFIRSFIQSCRTNIFYDALAVIIWGPNQMLRKNDEYKTISTPGVECPNKIEKKKEMRKEKRNALLMLNAPFKCKIIGADCCCRCFRIYLHVISCTQTTDEPYAINMYVRLSSDENYA